MDFHPQRKDSFVSGSGRLCQISSKSVQNCDRESTDTQTDRQTDRQTHTQRKHKWSYYPSHIICPMLCYSNGTDNKLTRKVKWCRWWWWWWWYSWFMKYTFNIQRSFRHSQQMRPSSVQWCTNICLLVIFIRRRIAETRTFEFDVYDNCSNTNWFQFTPQLKSHWVSQW